MQIDSPRSPHTRTPRQLHAGSRCDATWLPLAGLALALLPTPASAQDIQLQLSNNQPNIPALGESIDLSLELSSVAITHDATLTLPIHSGFQVTDLQYSRGSSIQACGLPKSTQAGTKFAEDESLPLNLPTEDAHCHYTLSGYLFQRNAKLAIGYKATVSVNGTDEIIELVQDFPLLLLADPRSPYESYGCSSAPGHRSGSHPGSRLPGLGFWLVFLGLSASRRRHCHNRSNTTRKPAWGRAPLFRLSAIPLLLATLPSLEARAQAGAPSASSLQMAPADLRLHLALSNLSAPKGFDPTSKQALEGALEAAVTSLNVYQVSTLSQVRAQLSLAKQQKLLGCSDTCLQDLAGALDVDRLLYGSIAGTGDRFILSLSLSNTRENLLIRTQQLSAKVSEGLGPLLDGLPKLIASLIEADGLAYPPAPSPQLSADLPHEPGLSDPPPPPPMVDTPAPSSRSPAGSQPPPPPPPELGIPVNPFAPGLSGSASARPPARAASRRPNLRRHQIRAHTRPPTGAWQLHMGVGLVTDLAQRIATAPVLQLGFGGRRLSGQLGLTLVPTNPRGLAPVGLEQGKLTNGAVGFTPFGLKLAVQGLVPVGAQGAALFLQGGLALFPPALGLIFACGIRFYIKSIFLEAKLGAEFYPPSLRALGHKTGSAIGDLWQQSLVSIAVPAQLMVGYRFDWGDRPANKVGK